MQNKLYYYYGFLALVLCAQILSTVITLSQNIGYGQNISMLEKRKSAFAQQVHKNEQTVASQLALKQLNAQDEQLFSPITQVVLVNRQSSNVASVLH